MCSSFFYTIVRDNTGQAQTARFVTPALPQREPLPRRTKMAKGFTDLKIKNLKAGAVRREIPDPGASGLYLVVQPSGKKSFAVRYRYNGTPRRRGRDHMARDNGIRLDAPGASKQSRG